MKLKISKLSELLDNTSAIINIEIEQYIYQIPTNGIGFEVHITQEFTQIKDELVFWCVEDKIAGIDTKFINGNKEILELSYKIAKYYATQESLLY